MIANSPPVSKIINQPLKRVRIASIEAELGILWAQFNRDSGGAHTVMRACMSNLIIYCDTPEEAAVVGQEITKIVDIHPARVLLLVGDGQPGIDSIEALITIYYTALDEDWQVCAERIDVVAASASAERLPSVARSQLIGDLPTTLWWVSRRPPPEVGDVFFQLAELADQIIYDNMGWINPIKGISVMTRWVAAQQNEQVVYNLAWRRIALWRKLLSQMLDPQIAPGALEGLRVIEIDHGPHALAMTWLLVGWLASQLKWRPVDGKQLSNSELVWKFHNNHHEIRSPPNVYRRANHCCTVYCWTGACPSKTTGCVLSAWTVTALALWKLCLPCLPAFLPHRFQTVQPWYRHSLRTVIATRYLRMR
jgi:hypothetical protein